ncbi:hypothetical protein LY78DRAFT_348521 [Colletotrichum sublineola]|nr:hypothetical protein LY78DRAFT_348521 [Colletotrichum sublineola]
MQLAVYPLCVRRLVVGLDLMSPSLLNLKTMNDTAHLSNFSLATLSPVVTSCHRQIRSGFVFNQVFQAGTLFSNGEESRLSIALKQAKWIDRSMAFSAGPGITGPGYPLKASLSLRTQTGRHLRIVSSTGQRATFHDLPPLGIPTTSLLTANHHWMTGCLGWVNR